jgi:hypothetical protein
MVADGYPVKAIAHALGRSVNGVTGMCRKAGLRVLRGKTIAVQIQLLADCHASLTKKAKARGMTLGTYIRLEAELIDRSPAFEAKLLDLDRVERNLDAADAVSDDLTAVCTSGTNSTMPALVKVVPNANGPPVKAVSRLSPELLGSIH